MSATDVVSRMPGDSGRMYTCHLLIPALTTLK